MPAPSKVKTWQFNLNSLQRGANYDTSRIRILNYIKDKLKGFGSTPWTVSGSSNSSASGMDGTDRWTSTNLQWNSAGNPHSWIVLRQTGLAAKCEICFDCANVNTHLLTVVVSPVNGFGTVNGGTDGSTAARPTATDEMVILNGGDWITGSANNTPCIVHCMQSTDGKCTRVIICANGYPVSLFMFDYANNALSGWTGTKAYFSVKGIGNSTATQLDYTYYNNTNANVNFKHSTTAGLFYFATPGCVSSVFGKHAGGLVSHDLSGEWPFFAITLASTSTSVLGLFGTAYDLYWGTNANSNTIPMDYYMSGSALSWAQFGTLIVPWDGSSIKRMG
jgi:hypothetical protein